MEDLQKQLYEKAAASEDAAAIHIYSIKYLFSLRYLLLQYRSTNTGSIIKLLINFCCTSIRKFILYFK